MNRQSLPFLCLIFHYQFDQQSLSSYDYVRLKTHEFDFFHRMKASTQFEIYLAFILQEKRMHHHYEQQQLELSNDDASLIYFSQLSHLTTFQAVSNQQQIEISGQKSFEHLILFHFQSNQQYMLTPYDHLCCLFFRRINVSLTQLIYYAYHLFSQSN